MTTAGSFTKRTPGAPDFYFTTEAAGLAWLAEPGVVRVPAVLEVGSDFITVERVPVGQATPRGAERLGRALADLHASGAQQFGAPWPGFIGPLPMDNTPTAHGASSPGGWAAFYAQRRVEPFVRQARDAGMLDRDGARVIERTTACMADRCGSSVLEPPRRIHGDLWSGNVVWDLDGEAWLVDPAAHGGHRETDLAMLRLFGAPHLERIVAAYHEHWPLAEGWRERVGLHQLHPLLVHAVLFGGSYARRAVQAARQFTGG